MGLALIIIGLIVWLAAELFWVGIILIVLGIVLLFAPGPFYGYGWYRSRGAPPP